MILLCGIPSEGPLALAIEAAEACDIPHIVLNQRHAAHLDIELQLDSTGLHGQLQINGQNHDLERFNGVYIRLMEEENLPEHRAIGRRAPDRSAVRRSGFFHHAFLEWAELAPCRVVNRAQFMASNGSKPYQVQIIARVGFQTPPTLVTNDPAEAFRFTQEHRRTIYKSTSSIRSIVRECSARTETDLAAVRNLPTQFQARIDGTNVRVHVVDRAVFATEITSTAVDYRYAGREGLEANMTAIDLPDAIADRCVRLSRDLQLPFCGIDLMRTPDGEFYCLEVNPSPAYSFYQETTGQPIATALVRYLATGDPKESSACTTVHPVEVASRNELSHADR
jgi:glutathione synthase/RimK-type ligase-like ATP-grasp enzyme